MYYYMFQEHNDNICVYISINLFKQNKLNKDYRELIREFLTIITGKNLYFTKFSTKIH